MRNAIKAAMVLAAMAACGKGSDPAPPAPPPPAPRPPIRDAVGDSDLRVLLAELASKKACEMMKGQFRALRAPDRPGVSTGILWIRDCEITNRGTDVTFHLGGTGWQWARQTKKKAGGKFELAQYVRFAVDMPIPGSLDVAYSRSSHVISLLFTPDHVPEVQFTPIGDLDVDEKGWWSSVLGALSGLFGSSPEAQARTEAKGQGTREFAKQLADGLSVTINACTGLSRFGLGRQPKGKMVPADVGETFDVPVELQPSGMMVTGPYLARRGMTAAFDVAGAGAGRIRAAVMCHDDAEKLAAAYVSELELPEVDTLAVADIAGHGTVHVDSARCQVAVVVREIPTAGDAPVTFTWKRPLGESARSTGGPLIDCERPARTAHR